MKQLIFTLLISLFLLSGCNEVNTENAYMAKQFALEYPSGWRPVASDGKDVSTFSGPEVVGSPTFQHFRGDGFHPVIWREAETDELYTSTQGIKWKIIYSKVGDEFIKGFKGVYSETDRLVTIESEESLIEGFFVYEYDQELYPKAIDQLKLILDSVELKS